MIPRRITLHEVAHEFAREAVGEARLTCADAILAADQPGAPIGFGLLAAPCETDMEGFAVHHRSLDDRIDGGDLRG